MKRPFLLLSLLACRRCAGCTPDLNTDTNDQHTDHPQDTELVDTSYPDSDTDLPPPCPWPEVEPDTYDDPSALAMEEVGCGFFGAPFDSDWWTVNDEEDGWLRVRVDARAIGSRADPAVSLESDQGETAAQANRADGNEDILLVFPAAAGTWKLFLSDQLQNGDVDGFGYDVLVSSAKPPLDCGLRDLGSNDTQLTAQPLADSPCVQGDIATPGDVDWYQLRIPSGKHTITLDMDAATEGSPGDFRIDVYDHTGTVVAAATTGVQGWEADPYLTYVSDGDEDLSVRVNEQTGADGTAYWYYLGISVVSP